jgi:hypothetical protein
MCTASAYDEAGRAAAADVIKAERSKAVDVADFRVIEEYLRFKKFSLMVGGCATVEGCVGGCCEDWCCCSPPLQLARVELMIRDAVAA